MIGGGRAGGRSGFRWLILALIGAFVLSAVASDPAAARRRHGHKHYVSHSHGHAHKRLHHRGRVAGYNPPYADIIVDANSGRVLHATAPDSPRHPASLTKMMTLYLLFEQMEAGRMRLDTPMEVSAHAAAQAPSKLGLRPGSTITVEQGIKALVTKSANDAAVVIAEAVGGSEADFARRMTRKARMLGMTHTTYVNASGLPDNEQVTTARDQAMLGRALQDRFPRYYHYFSTPSFTFHGHTIRNHNHLTNHMEGVDGIKTGYIRASGFNLVTSMTRGGRHLVGVVLGGRSSGQRDARMRSLLEQYVSVASVRRTAPKIAEAADPAPVRVAQATRGIDLPPTTAADPEERTRNVAVRPADERLPARVFSPEPTARPTTFVKLPPPRPTRNALVGSVEPIKPIPVKTMSVRRRGGSAVGSIVDRQATASGASMVASAAGSDAGTESHPATHGDWVIQVGAFPAEHAAKDRLKVAQNIAKKVLSGAEPFTERVVKRDTTLYRARFAGFNHASAAAACKYLKRNDIVCLPLKN
jgi:D-alanyl-D-alanine carboxypeptidase